MPQGDIPAAFLESYAARYARLSLDQTSVDSADTADASAFWAESSYQLRQLLLSGKVLFGDSLSRYLQEITDRLLVSTGLAPGSIRAYAVKAAAVNAYATSDRFLLVNVGLVASLHHEAELAFVISHELAHVLAGHPRYLYQKTQELAQDKRTRWRRPDPSALLSASNLYSREIEYIADSLGLHRYLQAGYPPGAIAGAFAVLAAAQHPFGTLPFEADWLATPVLDFPDSILQVPSYHPIGAPNGAEEASTTHPQPAERLARLHGALAPGVDTLTPSPRFLRMQTLARFETCYQHLLAQSYQASFYECFVLLQQYPDNRFLQRLMVQTLYTLARYSNVGRRWEVLEDYLDLDGPARTAYFFIEKLDSDALNTLALAYAWRVHARFPADSAVRQICTDLMQELGRYYSDRFAAYDPELPQLPDSLAQSFARPALHSLLQEPGFAEALSDQLRKVRRSRQQEVALEHFRADRKGRIGHELELKGFGLGLEKVVFVDPFYQRADERPDQQGITYAASAQGEIDYVDMIQRYATDIGLQHEVISPQNMTREHTSRFQELILLQDWIAEETRHQQLNLVNFHQQAVHALRQRYGTPYFVWTGGLGVTRPRTGKGLILTGGLIFWPVLPYSIYYMLTPRHDTLLYSMIYNLETAEYVILYPKLLRMRDKPDVLQAATYDWLYQMRHRR